MHRHPAASTLLFCLLAGLAQGAEPSHVAEVERRLLAEARQGAEQHRKGDATVVFVRSDGRPIEGASVSIRQETHEFLFGALLFGLVGHGGEEAYRSDAFKSRFRSVFNLGILPFYWSAYETVPGRPQWQRMAGTIEWALLQARVTATVRGLAGSIDLWDVVNEPVNTVTWRMAQAEKAPGDDARYRFVPIPEVADWIEPLYRAARAANPRATLVLNEFNQVMKPEVRQRFLDLVKRLESRHAPVDALGLQVHEPLDAWFPPEEVRATPTSMRLSACRCT